jgi:hypothetical protein
MGVVVFEEGEFLLGIVPYVAMKEESTMLEVRMPLVVENQEKH